MSRKSEAPPPETAPAVPETFEPDRFYAVDLARPVPWRGRMLSPAHNPLELRGDVAQAVRDSIAAAKPIG
ncbi:hypothetical protein [Phenylobacterium sp.]|uniref:hypothetical protein n=1 Tax=Phenylobacterium sp. TaxID=1871053 RepID=UPI00301B8C91